MIWSAAIFAPIVLIFTFNNWKKEKSSELISKESRDLIVQMKVFSDGTKQLIGKIFCNYMHELENSNLQRFFPKKVDKSQLLNEWSNMYALRLQIHEKLYLITFNNNDAELMHKIEIYNSLIEQIDAYFHLNKDDLNDYSFLQKFTSSMESLIDELYSYSLFQKNHKIITIEE